MNKIITTVNQLVSKNFPSEIRKKMSNVEDASNTKLLDFKRTENDLLDFLNTKFKDILDLLKNPQHKNNNFWHLFFKQMAWHPFQDYYSREIFDYFMKPTYNNNQELLNQLDSEDNTIWHCLLSNPHLNYNEKALVLQQLFPVASMDTLFLKNKESKTIFDYFLKISTISNQANETEKTLILKIFNECFFILNDEQNKYFYSFCKNNNFNELILSLTDEQPIKNHYLILSEKYNLEDIVTANKSIGVLKL